MLTTPVFQSFCEAGMCASKICNSEVYTLQAESIPKEHGKLVKWSEQYTVLFAWILCLHNTSPSL